MEHLKEAGLLENAETLAKKAKPQAPHSLASSDLDGLNRFSVSLPHFADPKDLPGRLPTKEEIESSKEILEDGVEYGRKVVGVGAHFVVKYGVTIDPTEGENMLFVQQNTSVPVPRVYAVYTDMSDGKTYIIMERVTGVSLYCLWPKLSEAEKSVISAKLRRSMDQLRRLPTPGYYCSLGNRGLRDGFFRTETGGSMNTLFFEGPFDTEDELNAAMVKKHLSIAGLPQKTRFYESVVPQVFRDHPPTFSHGDIHLKNVVVRNLESLDGRGVEDLEVVLTDWELAGWYPSYWEYARALWAGFGWDCNDWNRWIPKILDEYLVEMAWMGMLIRVVWTCENDL